MEHAYLWGEIDVDEYGHNESPGPLNGDMHEVVPGKFIAFKGPMDLGWLIYKDDERCFRTLCPAHYADIVRDFDIEVVVRLNEAEYDAGELVCAAASATST